MNISKRSFATRLVCCLLVCLLLCCTVMRPVSASALATGATAGLAYVSVEAVIPWLLSALSVGYLISDGSLHTNVKEAISEWAVTSSLGQSLKAYSYGSQYYLDSQVVTAAATAINIYLSGDFSTACDIGQSFPKAYVISYTVLGDTYKSYYWGNSKPTYYYDDPYLIFLLDKPCVSFHSDHLFDFSADEKATYSSAISGGSLVSIEAVSPSSLAQSDVLTEVNTLASSAISVTDPSDGKKNAYPVISTQAADSSAVESTTTTVPVGAGTASGSSTDLSGILGWLAKIYNAIVSLAASITSPITTAIFEISSSIKEWWDAATTAITTAISDVRTAVTSINGTLMNIFRVRIEAISIAISTFQAKVETLWDTATTTITTAISSAITDIIEWLKSLGATIADILEWLLTLPGILVDSIIEALTAVFVPTEGYMDVKVEELRASFPLFDSIIGSAKQLRNFFNFGTTPPIIYIDLGASTSWAMGGRVVFIDMSWYAQYKPTMDLIISVFLWLFFLWRVFLALPGIISGTSGFWGLGSVEPPPTSSCTDISIIRR